MSDIFTIVHNFVNRDNSIEMDTLPGTFRNYKTASDKAMRLNIREYLIPYTKLWPRKYWTHLQKNQSLPYSAFQTVLRTITNNLMNEFTDVTSMVTDTLGYIVMKNGRPVPLTMTSNSVVDLAEVGGSRLSKISNFMKENELRLTNALAKIDPRPSGGGLSSR